MQPCPLCNSSSTPYYLHIIRQFLQCGNCLSVFLHPKDHLSQEAEKYHYLQHNNDPEDARYQQFLSPVVNAVLRDFGPEHEGLDFGSGTGSPIMKLLTDAKYNISEYDLFFHNYPELLQNRYNYITCSETAEHFKEPHKEFRQLRNLLKPGGKLYVYTDRFDPDRDFGTWYYKTDATHVFLYHARAFEWIMSEFNFSRLEFDGRLAVLSV